MGQIIQGNFGQNISLNKEILIKGLPKTRGKITPLKLDSQTKILLNKMQNHSDERIRKFASSIETSNNLDAKDSHGLTALMHAANKGYEEIVKFLLKNGASVNALSTSEQVKQNSRPNTLQFTGHIKKEAWSPLSFALTAKPINKNIVHMLINHGAKIFAKEKYNLDASPIEIALQRGQSEEIINYLLDHKGNELQDLKKSLPNLLLLATRYKGVYSENLIQRLNSVA